MFVSFNKIFNPTIGEQIEQIKKIIELRRKHIGHCVTCSHYIALDAPGFIEDYGRCKLNVSLFAKKVCGLSSDKCPNYKEEFENIKKLKEKLTVLEKMKENG